MFKIVDGDIFDSEEDFLCHQCNCVTTRSAHMSKAVFTRFPYADIYTPRENREQPDMPGTIVVAEGRNPWDRTVINMLGQYYPGFVKYPDSTKDGYKAREGHFQSCIDEMILLLEENYEDAFGDFAFPWRIGCGAAGGDWGNYIEMLKDFEAQINGDVVIYKLPG